MTKPHLPYRGSEGHAHHPASQNRATGRGTLQQAILDTVTKARMAGKTSRELEHELGRGHGSISSALSTLHDAGRLCMLEKQRDKQHIYVVPQHVRRRPTRKRAVNAGHRVAIEAHTALTQGDTDTAFTILDNYVKKTGTWSSYDPTPTS